MEKYKVKFKQTNTGYTEVFADSEQDAINRLFKNKPFGGMLRIENEYFDFTEPTIISTPL